MPGDPIAFANFCLKNGLGIEDVAALAPAWIFDIHGNKVGSKSFPWRVTEYISAFYMVKNPIATRNRIRIARREKKMSRKLGGGSRAVDSGEMKFSFELVRKGVLVPGLFDPTKGPVVSRVEAGDGSGSPVKKDT
jgi:hypothetical protein